jgi:16S rRNA (uracil1498-N3)-methyltransferase
MRTIRIYTAQPLNIGEALTLEPTASRHLVSVLRLNTGDTITLFNGQGGEFLCTLEQCSPKKVTVKAHGFEDVSRESPLNIHLGIGISRGDKMDWVIQKATEAGVTEITPLFTDRTEVKLKGDRAEKKMRHWQQVSARACEQCYRNQLPTLHPPIHLNEWIKEAQAEKKVVVHHRSQQTLSQLSNQKTNSVALLIGPEGGLTAQEVELAEGAQFLSLTLGPRVLRTETAPIIAIGILQSLWGDYQ